MDILFGDTELVAAIGILRYPGVIRIVNLLWY